MLSVFGWTAVYPQNAQSFHVNYLVGPLVSVDTSRGIIVIENKPVDYVITIDTATLILGRSGVITLAAIKINDSVSVEFRKYVDNKKVANHIVQKTSVAVNEKQAAKPDSISNAEMKSRKFTEKDTAKNRIAKQNKINPAIEDSKRLQEEILANRSREQLYHDIFNTSPPKRPREVDASLIVNETTDGTMEIVFTEDRMDFSMPAAPVMKILSKMVIPEILKKINATIDSTDRIKQSVLANIGLQTNFDNDAYQVKILVPSMFLLKQVHQLSGFIQDPYAVETVKPNAVSAYCNINADQKLEYWQNLSPDLSSVQNNIIKSKNKDIVQPFVFNLDGAINVKNVVLEGRADYQENFKYPLQRQDMRLLYDWQQKALRFSAGDLQYLTLGYQANVRMGGLSVAKDLSLQPYILTYPTGKYEFYLTDQAEAEIWVNDVIVSRVVLQAGTHDIRGFPFSTGNNNVKIILKDFSGRRDSIEFSSQYKTTLLAQGFSRYSCNLGFVNHIVNRRYLYNEDQPCLSLAYQRGISNKLTLDLYSQAFTSEINTRTFNNIIDTNTLFKKGYKLSPYRECMLGSGGLLAIKSGFLDWDAALSYIKNCGIGSALRLEYTYITRVSYKNSQQKNPAGLRLNNPLTWNTQLEYLSPKFIRSPIDSPYNYLEALKLSTDLYIPLSDQFFITTGGKYYVRRDTCDLFEISLRLQKNWLKNLNTSITFQYTTDIYGYEANPQVIASVQWLFRSNKNEFKVNEQIKRHRQDVIIQPTTSQTSQSDEKKWDFNTGFQWNYDDFTPRPERVLASVNGLVESEYNDYNALVGYTGNHGTIELTHDLYQPQDSGINYLQHRTDMILKTALVYVDKTVCFSRPIYSGGFMLAKGVKNLKGNKILVNPNDQGYESTTNIFGPAVLPLYSPYQLKKIKVEPENPPMGFVNEKSSFTLFPHYKSGFCLNIGSEKSVLVIGTLHDFDGSPFAYQNINIVGVTDKKNAPVATFTNSIGRFQFLGHENQTYKIAPPLSTAHEPITILIPPNNKGFFQIGVLKFTEKGIQIDTSKSDTVKVDTGEVKTGTGDTNNIDTVKVEPVKVEPVKVEPVKAESVKAESVKAESVKAESVKAESVKAESVKADTFDIYNVDTSKIKWITVWGSLTGVKGEPLSLTSIAVSCIDTIQTTPPNTIYYPNTVTKNNGVFVFVCRNPGEYKIVVASGDNKEASATFNIPKGTKGVFNIGGLRVIR
jgi:outer membrane usher protein